MGFWDLHFFNLAMLGKHGWNFVSNLHTLANRLIKAKYFPHGNFLSTQLGSNPSYTWKSRWSAQSILKMGCRWRIGNVKSINVWQDFWLKDDTHLHLLTPIVEGLENLMVQDLFIPRTWEWDIELLQELSCPRDVQAIAQTPNSTTRGGDQLIWHFTKNGMYLVKLGYRLSLSGRDQHVSVGNRGNWLTIWNLKLPPRVKIFLWRACLGCLPVLATLQGRGIQLNPLCPICHREPEIIMHALLLCGNVKYHLANYNLDPAKWATGSLANVILTNSPFLSKAHVSTLATVVWTI